MWRTTGEEKWRERGWAVFQAIQKETKTSSGYASVSTVEQSPSPKLDEMPRSVPLVFELTFVADGVYTIIQFLHG